MNTSLPDRLRGISHELKALAAGHWQMLRQEMSGKVSNTTRQTIWMAAGVLTALTAILLVLSGLTLLLSQLLVSLAGWEPLLAGGVSALIIAVIFALAGYLVFRRGGTKLKEEGLAPVKTLTSLKATAQALTNQPVIPNPPPPDPMKTRQQFQDALHETADAVEHQARRAGRAVQDTARNLSDKFDPGAFFSEALTWVDALMTPRNRAVAGRALSAAAVLPRRHPGVAAALGAGALFLWWKSRNETPATVQGYVDDTAATIRDGAENARRAANNGFSAASKATRDLRSTLFDTAHRVAENGRSAASQFSNAAGATAEAVRDSYDNARESVYDSVGRITDTAKQLRDDAEAGLRKAKEFAKEEPALAIAGGVALAIGAALLVRSSRR